MSKNDFKMELKEERERRNKREKNENEKNIYRERESTQ